MSRSNSSNIDSEYLSSISSWKYEYWFPKSILSSTFSYSIFMVRGWVLMAYPCFVYFFIYQNTLFSNSRCPSLGDTENILIDVPSYTRSNLPDTINHWETPIICLNYLWTLLSRNVVLSHYGCSLTFSGNTYFLISPFFFWYLCNISLTYFFEDTCILIPTLTNSFRR